MKNFIHPTAIVDDNAKIGGENYIGPYCIIGPNVVIGNGNRFEAYVSIGTSAEHRDYFRKPPGKVKIGNDNIFRESITVNAGTTEITTVGDRITALRGCHVGHDAIIHDDATLSCNTLIGGHSVIGTRANIGLGACIHQFRVIGALSLVGMNSSVTKNTPPFVITYGVPAEIQKINTIGLRRAGLDDDAIMSFEDWFLRHKNLYMDQQELNHEFKKYLEEFYEYASALEEKRQRIQI